MDLGLEGRTVLVTGASRGIGRAVAEAFAAEGARLCLVSRSQSDLQSLRDMLAEQHKCAARIHVADLAARGSAHELKRAFPDVDILVNNAGAIPKGDVVDLDEEGWRQGWELKVFGYINLTREYYRDMRARRGGVIVNIIGFSSEKLDEQYVAGSSGNAALVAFTRAVGSVSLDHNVRVFGINPGYVETDRSIASSRRRAARELGDPERWRELMAHMLPGGRMLAPAAIADVVAFAASDRGCGISGQVLTVDAGFGSRSYYGAPTSM